MSAHKRSVVFALAGGAAAVAAVLAAGPASATPVTPAAKPWTISKGGPSVAVAPTITVRDTTAKRSIACYLSTLKLDLKTGKKLAGAGAGTLTGASFGECTLPMGLPVEVRVAGLPWHLDLKSYDAAAGVTSGTLDGVHVGISVPEIGCSAVGDGTGADARDGSIAATYRNKSAVLETRAGGTLRLYDVSKCDGLIKDGDSLSLSGDYKVSPAAKITAS